MTGAARTQIGVIGASVASEQQLASAHTVGLALARAGAVLITGGLGGVMQAACRGAREGNATTVGILPGSELHLANPYVDVAIATGIGELRNGLIVRSSQALIAIGGGFGTLSEIALALQAARPVVALESWDLSQFKEAVRHLEDPEGAVALALQLAEENSQGDGHGVGVAP
jgi:uncharacterized protein (TIGR00725 family)